ncbi:restriction endonuclease subunit S [Aeromonas veronii]|uniref:restriction endonuclease subunit S n=1 Tax=Aeromonas veronii TaxID=654 RepID=UPI0035B87EF8
MSEAVTTRQQELAVKYHPYPEYKDSGVEWLQLCPSSWETKALKYIVSCNDEVLSESTDPDMEFEYIDIGGVSSSEGITRTESMRFSEAPSRARRIVRQGDIIVSTVRTYLEAIAPISLEFDGKIASTGFAVLRPKYLLSGFAKYALRARHFIDSVVARSTGVSYPAINSSELIDIKIVVPSLKEQQTIASFLDYETVRIARLIAQQQRLIELLKEKRQAVISHAVTKGLNPDVPMKNSGVEWLGQVPEHWITHALKYAASSCKKSFTDGDWIETPYISDEGVRLIQTGNIGIGHFKEQGFRYISERSFKTLKCTEVKPNDVLICRLDGPVGRSCLAPHLDVKMITSVDNAILKPSDDFDAEFLVYLTNSVGWLEWIQDICRVGGGFRLRISRTMLGEQIIPVPPIDEQKAIAKELNLLSEYTDLCIQKCTEAIALLVERRSALISAAVTGKIDLRGWTPPADEVAA